MKKTSFILVALAMIAMLFGCTLENSLSGNSYLWSQSYTGSDFGESDYSDTTVTDNIKLTFKKDGTFINYEYIAITNLGNHTESEVISLINSIGYSVYGISNFYSTGLTITGDWTTDGDNLTLSISGTGVTCTATIDNDKLILTTNAGKSTIYTKL